MSALGYKRPPPRRRSKVRNYLKSRHFLAWGRSAPHSGPRSRGRAAAASDLLRKPRAQWHTIVPHFIWQGEHRWRIVHDSVLE